MQEESIQKLTKEDYYALSEETHIEFIDGVIYDISPAPPGIHQEISRKIYVQIADFIKHTNGSCNVYSAPFNVELSCNTVVQPDISVICDRTKLTDKGCNGAPDWIIEIVSDDAAHNYIHKLDLYLTYGVREYWIVDPKKQSVTVYHFGKSFEMTYYIFLETIPVGIYEDKLEINISYLIN